MEHDMDAPHRGIGDNSAPFEVDHADLLTMLNPAVVKDQLGIDYARYFERRDELLAGVKRLFATLKQIETEDQAEKAADFVKQLKPFWKQVEASRVEETAPLRDALSVHQLFFVKEFLDVIKLSYTDIEGKLTIYGRAKIAREQKRLADEKKAAQAIADAAAAKAAAEQTALSMLQAASAAKTAEKAEAKVEKATTPSLGRVRSASGSISTMVDKWEVEVTDEQLVQARHWKIDLTVAQGEVNAGLRDAPDGTPALPGMRIVNRSRASVR